MWPGTSFVLSKVNDSIENFKGRNGKYYENSLSSQDPGLIIKDAIEIIENKAKEQKGGFLGMLLRTLGASSLG